MCSCSENIYEPKSRIFARKSASLFFQTYKIFIFFSLSFRIFILKTKCLYFWKSSKLHICIVYCDVQGYHQAHAHSHKHKHTNKHTHCKFIAILTVMITAYYHYANDIIFFITARKIIFQKVLYSVASVIFCLFVFCLFTR